LIIKYLERIGQFYFNINNKTTHERGNMFSNLLRALTSNESNHHRIVQDDDDQDDDSDLEDEHVYENTYLD
jgi:hypothetical protein